MRGRVHILILCFWTLNVYFTHGQEWVDDLEKFYRAKDSCISLHSDSVVPLRQIILIRHGEPALNKKGWRNRKEAVSYFADYDSAGIIPFDSSPLCTRSLSTTIIYHSPLPRACQTAEMAFPGDFDLKGDVRFREFERKVMSFCNIKMPLRCWTINSRLLWFMGLNDKGIEPFRQAKERARENAGFLAAKAASDEQVVLVAHGLHNRYVKKFLKQQGWKVVYDSGNAYLSMKVMAREMER